MFKKLFNLNKLSTLLLYSSILIFIIAFNFEHNPPGGWYQQFMPNLNGRQVIDITFLDSLTGYAITTRLSKTDSSFILKTTNGGDNWNVNHLENNFIFKRIQFINQNTGFVGGTGLIKTTDGGSNWSNVNPSRTIEDMIFLNKDTGWCAYSEGLTGGVFRTINSGQDWTQQYNAGIQNPDKIYMFNSRIGFIVKNNSGAPTLRKTTDGGFNWFSVLNEGFTDMHFIDSLTGWKCWWELDSIKKTMDGGISWIKLFLPPTGGFYNLSAIRKFSFLNKDTIWGVGARGSTSLGFRGLIYKSTNGGQNWGYQLPDINTINMGQYNYVKFINKLNGWAYSQNGVHTKTGGDSITYYTGVQQISSEVPRFYSLKQNYPNPFNPTTKIKFEITYKKPQVAYIKLIIYNIKGQEVSTLVNQKLNAGTYETDFNAFGLPSGIYFYSLFIEGEKVDTKKMMLIR